MQKPFVVLMTRWPAPYRCKKRLSKAIGCERAASIQTHLTFHTISVAKELKKKGMITGNIITEIKEGKDIISCVGHLKYRTSNIKCASRVV